MKYMILASVAVVAVVPQIAAAKEKPPVFVEAKMVKDAPSVTLDPSKAYILLRTPGATPVAFSKVPTAEDATAYERLKAAVYADARENYAKKLVRYESDRALAAKTAGMKAPTPPVEPTEANFRFATFEQLANFGIGPFNRFANKPVSVYLHAVTPGTYRIMGQMSPVLGGGLCYCMGSVTFQAVAGNITDLGTLDADPDAPPPPKGDSSAPRVFAYALTLTPASSATVVDPRLAALPRVDAQYRAAGKTVNAWGIAVARLPRIAGVLDYERDRIIDVAASTQSAAPTSP